MGFTVIYNSFEDLEQECEFFNGYDFYYSQENNDYYYISDYTCNKSLDIITSMSFIESTSIIESASIVKSTSESISIVESKSIVESTSIIESTFIIEEEFVCILEKCSECDKISSAENLCITCNESNGFYPLKRINNEPIEKINNYTDCFNNITKPTNFFFNNSMKYYEPCYETCEKCDYGGNKINNNCILCEFGYISIEGINNTFNCIIKCPYYFYYTKYGQYKCSKLTICPEDYYLKTLINTFPT